MLTFQKKPKPPKAGFCALHAAQSYPPVRYQVHQTSGSTQHIFWKSSGAVMGLEESS